MNNNLIVSRLMSELSIIRRSVIKYILAHIDDKDEKERVKNILDKEELSLQDLNDLLLDYFDKELDLDELFVETSYDSDLYNKLVNFKDKSYNNKDNYDILYLFIIYESLISCHLNMENYEIAEKMLSNVLTLYNDLDCKSFYTSLIANELPKNSLLAVARNNNINLCGADKDILLSILRDYVQNDDYKLLKNNLLDLRLYEYYIDNNDNKEDFNTRYNNYLNNSTKTDRELLRVYTGRDTDKHFYDKDIYSFVEFLERNNLYNYKKIRNVLDLLSDNKLNTNNSSIKNYIKRIYNSYMIDNYYNNYIPTEDEFIEYYNNNYMNNKFVKVFGVDKLDKAILYYVLDLENYKDLIFHKHNLENLGNYGKRIVEDSSNFLNANHYSRTRRLIKNDNKDLLLKLMEDNNISLEDDDLIYHVYKYCLENPKRGVSVLNKINWLADNSYSFRKHVTNVRLYEDTGVKLSNYIINKYISSDDISLNNLSKDILNNIMNTEKKIIKNFDDRKIKVLSKYAQDDKHYKALRNNLDTYKIISDKVSLDLLKEFSNLLKNNENINLYEEIVKKYDFIDLLFDKCMEDALKKMPDLKTEVKQIKQKFDKDKRIYNLREDINFAVDYINSKDVCFVFYAKRNGIKNISKEYDRLANILLYYDSNLYYDFINHEHVMCINMIKDYLNSSSYANNVYVDRTKINERDFVYAKSYVKSICPELFEEYLIKKNHEKSKRFLIIQKKIDVIMNAIVNGVVVIDNKRRSFDILDYYLYTKLTPNDFLDLVNKYKTVNHADYVKIVNFLQNINNVTPLNIRDVYNEKRTINNVTISDEVKDAVLLFIKDKRLPFDLRIYNLILKRYMTNEIDLSKYMNNTSIKSLKLENNN
ncbi:MAG: hypothetical protein VZS44_02640 [Bacilli bacterium]|nr:hypothetical protein [Bacilli bacterium]